jgi:hypothetical protein
MVSLSLALVVWAAFALAVFAYLFVLVVVFVLVVFVSFLCRVLAITTVSLLVVFVPLMAECGPVPARISFVPPFKMPTTWLFPCYEKPLARK